MSSTTTQVLGNPLQVSKDTSSSSPTVNPQGLTVVKGWNTTPLPATRFLKPYSVAWDNLPTSVRDEFQFGQTVDDFTDLQILITGYYGRTGRVQPVAGWTGGGWHVKAIFRLDGAPNPAWDGFYLVAFNYVLRQCTLHYFPNTATCTIEDFSKQDHRFGGLNDIPALPNGKATMKAWDMPFFDLPDS
ncbi:hypothetical protein C8R47DRAFT_1152216 [Mycena vitilis]|nr:hypothetical protein C8R47DRAFT_1152216 [Mycena vitilis]